MLIFLDLSGGNHSVTIEDVIEIFLKVASSKMTRDELEAFLREKQLL